MPREIEQVEKKQVETVCKSVACDFCGTVSHKRNWLVNTYIEWNEQYHEDGGTIVTNTICCLEEDNNITEVIICPVCFKNLLLNKKTSQNILDKRYEQGKNICLIKEWTSEVYTLTKGINSSINAINELVNKLEQSKI